jgi:hypothetical protein
MTMAYRAVLTVVQASGKPTSFFRIRVMLEVASEDRRLVPLKPLSASCTESKLVDVGSMVLMSRSRARRSTHPA